VRRAAENRLSERREGDFLGEEVAVGGQLRGLGEVRLEAVVGGEVAAVEGEEQVAQPGVGRGDEAVEDGVQQQLTEVVDRVGDQGGDAEVVGAGLGFGGGEGVEVDAGEVEEGVLVVSAVVAGGLVVGRVDAVEGRVHFGLDAVEGVEDAFGCVEVFAGGGGVGEAQLDVGGGDEGVDVGILGGGLVDFLREVREEGEAFLVICLKEISWLGRRKLVTS